VSEGQAQKFKQAAFAYLMVGLLYESAVFAVWRAGHMPTGRGSVGLWLVLGAAITALIVWALWRYRNPWIPRVIFTLHALRLAPLIGNAFFPAAEAQIPASFFGAALAVVIINLWMLARAGWDL
jgi:glucan phosphoethanolaminetransferase (alkaline phosphatase superfamily)